MPRRVHQNTHWRIYVRVLPVVFLAVMAAGAVGWAIYTRVATENLIARDTAEVRYLVEAVRSQTLIETLRLETHRRPAAGVDATAPGSAGLLQSVAGRDNLWGLALVGPVEAGATSWRVWSLDMTASDERAVGVNLVAEWLGDQNAGRNAAVAGLAVGHAPAVRPTFRDGTRSVRLFAPLLLGDQTAAAGPTAVLPVMVEDETGGGAHRYPVYFLRLDRLVNAAVMTRLVADPRTWWAVLDPAGRVVGASHARAHGRPLVARPRDASGGVLGAVSGAELIGTWQPGQPWHRHLAGNRLQPWVVTAGHVDDLPLTVLLGHETRHVMAISLSYVFAVLGVALLAEAIAIFGIARVIGPFTARMTALSVDMAKVAAGDYSRRIEDAENDEVAHLVRYFNLMADSLDETDRELLQKTRSLETALHNRQLLDRAKDDFLVLISHEVRTPLTAIMGGVDVLRGLVRRADTEQQALLERMNVTEVLDIIECNGQRLRSFMTDAIQMTSIQSSDQELDLKPEPVGTLIELGLCGVREMAQMRRIRITNELERETRWEVLCDLRVLTIAFEKIMKNAVVHNHDEGEVVIREVDAIPGVDDLVRLTTAEDVHRLMSLEAFGRYHTLPITWRAIEIFNTGNAIPAERCEALFAKFELVGRIENHQRGSGLSLAIAQSAVEHHGGHIFVEGIRNRGNSFYLLLPTLDAVDLQDTGRGGFGSIGGTQQTGQGVGRRTGDEEVSEVRDPALV